MRPPSPPVLQVSGYCQAGTGTAGNNLRTQIPLIGKEFPEILGLFAGTINVRFEAMIIVAGRDHRTNPIRWLDNQAAGEVFDLVWVELKFPEIAGHVRALLYVAHWSPHRQDPHVHEFIAEAHVQGLQYGMAVEMHCPRPFIELPPYCAKTFVIL